jgi:hypothetical protein
MTIPLLVTDTVVEAFVKCPRKALLRLTQVPGQPSEYVALQQSLDAEYRSAALSMWLERRPQATVVKDPPSTGAAKGSEIITGVVVSDVGEECRFDALERVEAAPYSRPRCSPLAFVRLSRLTIADRVRLTRKESSR